MRILGIETSCDETSASVVENGRKVLSNVVATSLKDHQRFGGVIPEIASRRQLEYINIVTTQALKDAGVCLKGIDAVAVTRHPGLIGSLLVGISFASSLSYALKKPLIKVNHIEAHLYANYLYSGDEAPADLPLPAVGLVVSGGHSSLFYISDFQHFRLIGETRDDAAGEAYDKVARILGLGYPGGPVIDKLARTVGENDIKFRCAPLEGSSDFSFSGIKTAVLYHQQRHPKAKPYPVEKVAAAFQDSVVEVLTEKSVEVCKKKKVKTLLIGGGVAANSALRERLNRRAAESGLIVHFPPLPLCMDNAAMVAGLGFHRISASH